MDALSEISKFLDIVAFAGDSSRLLVSNSPDPVTIPEWLDYPLECSPSGGLSVYTEGRDAAPTEIKLPLRTYRRISHALHQRGVAIRQLIGLCYHQSDIDLVESEDPSQYERLFVQELPTSLLSCGRSIYTIDVATTGVLLDACRMLQHDVVSSAIHLHGGISPCQEQAEIINAWQKRRPDRHVQLKVKGKLALNLELITIQQLNMNCDYEQAVDAVGRLQGPIEHIAVKLRNEPQAPSRALDLTRLAGENSVIQTGNLLVLNCPRIRQLFINSDILANINAVQITAKCETVIAFGDGSGLPELARLVQSVEPESLQLIDLEGEHLLSCPSVKYIELSRFRAYRSRPLASAMRVVFPNMVWFNLNEFHNDFDDQDEAYWKMMQYQCVEVRPPMLQELRYLNEYFDMADLACLVEAMFFADIPVPEVVYASLLKNWVLMQQQADVGYAIRPQQSSESGGSEWSDTVDARDRMFEYDLPVSDNSE
eukprot:TRINITY_DN2199_c0_g1_i1.p1 TRINITY_DN2199_c0_g1~~TRINITY_DN2199_c0_g1_i1.p1  ORF type:complete len:483 (+),score=48.96 TRINITY_DN2199_c0_g1_i1:2-1450(+)